MPGCLPGPNRGRGRQCMQLPRKGPCSGRRTLLRRPMTRAGATGSRPFWAHVSVGRESRNAPRSAVTAPRGTGRQARPGEGKGRRGQAAGEYDDRVHAVLIDKVGKEELPGSFRDQISRRVVIALPMPMAPAWDAVTAVRASGGRKRKAGGKRARRTARP